MNGHSRSLIAGSLAMVAACGLIAVGCGGDDDTTTTTGSAASTAEQTVDSAVKSCSAEAQQLGGASGTALGTACTSVGNTAKQALSSGSEGVDEALSKAADSCHGAVSKLPAGEAQTALKKLCDSISGAE